MPPFRRRKDAVDADRVEGASETPVAAGAPSALSLADEADAEAAEAEAVAAAARARAKAIRLRREAQEAEASKVAEAEQADTSKADSGDEAVAAKAGTSDETSDEADVAEALDIDAFEEDTKDSDGKSTRSGRGRRVGFILGVVAATLAVLASGVLIFVSVLMVRNHRHIEAEQQMKAEYNAAGRQSVVTLMSLDFKDAQANVKRIIDNATGSFKEDFQSQAPDFVKVAQDAKVVTDVNVTSTAVQTMDQNSATVLVSATSRVTNAAGAKQEPRAWRLAVNLQRDGGQIKMSKVEFVP